MRFTTLLTDRDNRLALVLCLALAVAGVVMDLPAPGADDLFYTGPALSLAQHGTLRAPLLDGQGFLSKDFLIYPPFYQYLLGAWLKVFGVSTKSILAFTQLGYVVAALAAGRVARRLCGLPAPGWVWPPLVMLGLLLTLGAMGLRPDVWGFAVMLLGLGVGAGAGVSLRVAAWGLLGCSVLVSPNVLPFAAMLAVLGFVREHGWKPRELVRELGVLVVAAVLVLGLFGLSIGFRWGEFMRAFEHHATRAVLPPMGSLVHGLRRYALTPRFGPATQASLVVIILAGLDAARAAARGEARARRLLTCLAIVLAAGVASVVMTWVRVELRLFTLVLSAGGACAYWLAVGGRGRKVLALGGLVAVFGLAAWIKDPLEPRWIGFAKPDARNIADARARVAAEPGRRYLIDSYTARSVFDYRLPANARDWFFSQPFPGLYPRDLADLKPDETWIVSGDFLRLAEPEIQHFAPYFRLGPLRFVRMAREFDVFVIDGRAPAEAQLGLGPEGAVRRRPVELPADQRW